MVEDALQRGQHQVDGDIAFVAQNRTAADYREGLAVLGLLGQALAVLRFAEAEGRDDLDIVPAKRGADARREIQTVDEAGGLIERLGAVEKAGAAVEGNPEGPVVEVQFVLPFVDFSGGHFADFDGVGGGGALKLDVPRGDKISAEIVPVLGHETHGLCF